MMRARWLPVAFLCSAIGFLTQWREQWFSASPPPEKVLWDPKGSWFHNMKNQSTEWVRGDAEYWSKLFCFVIVVLAVLCWVLA